MPPAPWQTGIPLIDPAAMLATARVRANRLGVIRAPADGK
jgi:hypothetical protein